MTVVVDAIRCPFEGMVSKCVLSRCIDLEQTEKEDWGQLEKWPLK